MPSHGMPPGMTMGPGSTSATALSTITVAHGSPVVTSPGAQTSAEGAAVSLQISATDPDGYTPLSYAATGLPAGLAMNQNGLISGTVSYSAAETNGGSYSVTVTATDSVGLSGTTTFAWTVTDTNRPPVVTRPANQQTAEAQAVSLTVAASDPDGDPFTFSASGLPAGLSISSCGVISSTVDYSAAETGGGTYNVTVSATDSHGAGGSASFTWTITNTDRPPTLTNPGNEAGAEGDAVSVQLSASDPDTAEGDTLSYTASGLPAGLTVDAASGLISGTILYNAAEASGGVYNVLVIAADGHGSSASQSFTWTVADTNRPPTVTNPGGQQSAEGSTVSLPVSAAGPLGSVSGTFWQDGGSGSTSTLHETGQTTLYSNGSRMIGTYTLDTGSQSHNNSWQQATGTQGSGNQDSNQWSQQSEHDAGTDAAGLRRKKSFVLDTSAQAGWYSFSRYTLPGSGSQTEADGNSSSELHEGGQALSMAGSRVRFNSYSFTGKDHRHQHTTTSGSDGTGSWQADRDLTTDSSLVQTGAGTSGSYVENDSGSSWSHSHLVAADGTVTDTDDPPGSWAYRWTGDLDLSSGAPVMTTRYGGSVGGGVVGDAWWSLMAQAQAGGHQMEVWQQAFSTWARKPWAEEVLDVLNLASNGQATDYLASEEFGQKLDMVDGAIAGFDDGLTGGLSTRVRTWLWGDSASRNHSGAAFQAGQIAGMLYGAALSMASPCGTSALASWGLRGLNAVRGVGSAINAYENYQQGNYLGAAMDATSAVFDFSAAMRACFAPEAPIVLDASGASKRADAIRVGDLILSGDEFDPEAPPQQRPVEEVFTSYARLLNVHIGSQVIRTTAEHPLYVRGKGWLRAQDLKPGDLLRSHDSRWVPVDEVLDSGEGSLVYNFRVAEYHTYFVGGEEWGFSVWAHNACVYASVNPETNEAKYVGVANRGLTKTLAQRLKAAENLTGLPAKVIPGTENLTPRDAEAVEMALINLFGRQGVDSGGTLLNQMPGVNFNEANLARGYEVLLQILTSG